MALLFITLLIVVYFSSCAALMCGCILAGNRFTAKTCPVMKSILISLMIVAGMQLGFGFLVNEIGLVILTFMNYGIAAWIAIDRRSALFSHKKLLHEAG